MLCRECTSLDSNLSLKFTQCHSLTVDKLSSAKHGLGLGRTPQYFIPKYRHLPITTGWGAADGRGKTETNQPPVRAGNRRCQGARVLSLLESPNIVAMLHLQVSVLNVLIHQARFQPRSTHCHQCGNENWPPSLTNIPPNKHKFIFPR